MNKVSVSSYSFDQYIRKNKLTQLSLIDKAHEMGFEYLDYTEIVPEKGYTREEYAKKIFEKADSLGMKVACYAVGANMTLESAEEDDAEFERVVKELEIAKILGTNLFRHDASFKLASRFKTFGQALPTMAENILRITKRAEQMGIKTMIENHGFICQDSDRLEQIVTAVNHPNFGLLLDMGNFMCVDEDSALATSRCAPYAFHVHAKDFIFTPYSAAMAQDCIITRGCNGIRGSVIGEGVVPVQQCLQILKRAGFDGAVGIEYEGAEDCLQGIKKGYKNLKGFMDKLF